jgi:hypothetical protein
MAPPPAAATCSQRDSCYELITQGGVSPCKSEKSPWSLGNHAVAEAALRLEKTNLEARKTPTKSFYKSLSPPASTPVPGPERTLPISPGGHHQGKVPRRSTGLWAPIRQGGKPRLLGPERGNQYGCRGSVVLSFSRLLVPGCLPRLGDLLRPFLRRFAGFALGKPRATLLCLFVRIRSRNSQQWSRAPRGDCGAPRAQRVVATTQP